ncbi:ATP-binding protein, partial [Planctomycetota bacterium]
NALDAVETKRGVITVTAAYNEETREAILTVNDNGTGIEPDLQGDIFKAFVSSKGQGGTGLGLAVVKKIIQEHNGDIKVTSKPGKGTTFTIKLPTLAPDVIDSGGTIGPTRRPD